MKNTNITEFINFILTVVLFGGNNRIRVISLYGKKIHFSQSDSVTVRKLCRFLCNFLFFVTNFKASDMGGGGAASNEEFDSSEIIQELEFGKYVYILLLRDYCMEQLAG